MFNNVSVYYICVCTPSGKDALLLLDVDVAPLLLHDVAGLPLLLDEGICLFILFLKLSFEQ